MSNIVLRALAAALVCTALSIAGRASAQGAGSGTVPGEIVARYLQQDLLIQPGSGFQRVHIGQSFGEVAARWGRPTATRSSLLGFTKYWIYKTGDKSSIIVSGRKNVRGIEVVGGVNSPFQSAEGAKFGMSPHQITSIYGPPDKNDDLVKMEYLSKGITMTFKRGGLWSMYVFRPD